MRLMELDPRWVGYGGKDYSNKDGSPIPYRPEIGMSFECPTRCGERITVFFSNPSDGLPLPEAIGHYKGWNRIGDTFEALTLNPSIQRIGGCGWHGWLTAGEVLTI